MNLRILNCSSVCLLVIAIQFVDGAQYLKDVPGCNNQTIIKAEKYIQKLVSVGEGGRRFPENKTQLKKYCDESSMMINYLNNIADKCLMTDVRELSKIMIFSAKNAVKQFCKKRSKKLNELMTLTPCINKHLMGGECYKKFLGNIRDLQFIEDDKLKIPHACCQYVASIQCVETLVSSIPCTRKNSGTVMDFLGSVFGNTASVACGEYSDSSDKCERLGEMPKPNGTTSGREYRTFFFALIDLLESIK